MSGETSKRSNLIDVTYHHLHTLLSGQLEGTTVEQITEYLRPRVPQLSSVSRPFGKPNDASKKKIDSGSVKLRDGVTIRLEDADKQFVFAITKRFNIDEVEALILLRSFLYNEGLPDSAAGAGTTTIVEELLDAITPFYYSERLYALRVLIPLFRANAGGAEPVSTVAADMLPEIIPDGKAFATSLIAEYVSKTKARLPPGFDTDPKKAVLWAKQNMKEQLVILEVLFWTMWDYASCDGPLVAHIYETAYDTNLGSAQENSTLLLDEEGAQLQQDSAALWILITIEVLELERVADPEGIEISEDPQDKEIYWSSPDSLQRIHEIVMSHVDSQFACQYIAWAFVLSRLVEVCTNLKELPTAYRNFFETIVPPMDRSYSRGREPTHVLMSRAALSPEAGLFPLMLTLLTNSPVFVTSTAWKTGSSVTDPNAVAYRSVFKGLVISIIELIPVELIPDFDSFVDVWIALFGRSESQSVAGICRQFWQGDWHAGTARRAIFDVARSRFPVQSKALIRLLRAMTASGFLDTDPLSTVDHGPEGHAATLDDRVICAQHVLFFMDKLPTYTQVIPASACSGSHALYEKLPERMISASVSTGLTYTNLRSVKLPGGSTLPARSIGRLLSGDGGDFVVVSWQHEHSGWKILLEFLTDYVNRRRLAGGASHQDVSFGRRPVAASHTLKLEDIGVEMDAAGDDELVTEVFDLVRSVIQDHSELAEQLLEILESGDPVVAHSMLEAQPPDLVQLTTMVLEEALSRSGPQQKSSPCTQLITSAMSVLAALLKLPKYSNRVWLYIRSTSSLFGSERTIGFTSAVIASERLIGHYTMTLALLHLVRQLFNEASSSVLSVLQEAPRLQQVKEEVLMRAARFIHSEIWVEHVGWKYAQLGDRFEIGRRVSGFYTDILKHSPPTLKNAPFSNLSQAVFEALVSRATTSAVNPIVTALTTSSPVLAMLYSSRRYGDARRLIYMLESHLLLVRVLLHTKHKLLPSTPCLLEQALCTRVSGIVGSADPFSSSKLDPIEALAAYAKERRLGLVVPVEAMEVLFALCSSLSSVDGSSPTIVAYLSDPEATVSSLVRIVLHPYDDALLRNAVWNFITLAMDKEPALAGLFIRGQFRVPSAKGKEKANGGGNGTKTSSALTVASDMLEQWKELWELNPQLLASLLRFLDVVWEHGHEHKTSLDSVRNDAGFFEHLASIVKEELGPTPDYRTGELVPVDGVPHSDLHEAVSSHAYRTMVKAHALHILALDIRISLPAPGDKSAVPKPKSYLAIQEVFKNEEEISELISEAASRAYDPSLYDELQEQVQTYFSALDVDHLQHQEPVVERAFGDDFTFSTTLLQLRLQPFADSLPEQVDDLFKKLSSINLNLSLAHAQTTLTESWQHFLLQVVPFLRGEAGVRSTLLSLAANISSDIGTETRSGGMMSTIHHARLSLLLSLLEVVWFFQTDKKDDIQHFVLLVENLRGVVLNDAQPPAKSFLGQSTVPFHRPLLQVLYFCARQSGSLQRKAKTLNAQQRLNISATVEATLELVIDALRLAFDSARLRLDVDLDQDMEQLVAVFEQCTRPSLTPSTTLWLTRCQETDVIRASLQLFSQMDVAGFSDIALLRVRKQPLYAPHVLTFHLALASIPSAAERLASEGILAAYSENGISNAIKSGSVDVVLPELPGERSPVHSAYCTMLAVVSGVTLALGHHGHYFIADVCGFIQLYGDQIHRALSWTIGDTLTTPLLEEIEQTVNLFYAVSCSPRAAAGDEAIKRALNFFTSSALLLLQQVNYALTHHNHLASLFEPVTADERAQYEADSTGAAMVSASSDMVDLVKRPFVARLVHKLFQISGSVLSTLVNISRAERVLLADPDDWPTDQALIVPHSKVVLGEPVSVGTLLELGNCSLDVLRYLSDRPAMQTIAPAKGTEKALDVRDSVSAARRALEACLFYAVTQLAAWLAKPEFDLAAPDADMEDSASSGRPPSDARGEKERRTRRQSMTLAERFRRGMTGEMAADLQALLTRAKPVVVKSGAVLENKAVDLTQVLSQFVHDRIMMS